MGKKETERAIMNTDKPLDIFNRGQAVDGGVFSFTADEIAVIRKALATQEWQPIESAPKDGMRLLGIGHDGVVYTIKYAKKFAPQYGLREGAKGWYCLNTDKPIVGITHWMPLPTAPTQGTSHG